MDEFFTPNNVVGFTVCLLMLLQEAEQIASIPCVVQNEDELEDHLPGFVPSFEIAPQDFHSMIPTMLHNYSIFTSVSCLDEDLGFWVKPRSTTWFSRFLLEQYDNHRWVEMFRMTKSSVFTLADILKPRVQRHDTSYRVAIPVLIRIVCALFKLTQGANLTVCSEMFAIGRSTISKILREVVHAINDMFRHEITWPRYQRCRETQHKFYTLCGLPGVVGTIDRMHVSISKPKNGATNYYYFKSGQYSINCQAVVDSERRFLDLYLGMPGSTNDSRVLWRSSLYHLANEGSLMEVEYAVHGFTSYLIRDLEYPLMPWLMVPHRVNTQLSISETVYNRKLWKGRCVVENAFGILKQTFCELLEKTDLHITFVPDVILCCALLHNVLLGQSHEQVDELLQVLREEGLDAALEDEDTTILEAADGEIVNDQGTFHLRQAWTLSVVPQLLVVATVTSAAAESPDMEVLGFCSDFLSRQQHVHSSIPKFLGSAAMPTPRQQRAHSTMSKFYGFAAIHTHNNRARAEQHSTRAHSAQRYNDEEGTALGAAKEMLCTCSGWGCLTSYLLQCGRL